VARQRHKRAHDVARELLVEIGATRPEHIDPIKSAQKKGIEIAFGGLSGATARVCRNGSKAKIRVSDDIVQPGRRWFSIAHEIGHYLLGHAIANERSATSWERITCDKRPPHEEREADAFAVAHNMPADMVRAHCVLSPVDWLAARAIAAKFPASPVAAALRAVELSDGACAAAYCVGGRVAWAKRSATFPAVIPHGKPLDRASIAFAMCEGNETDDRRRTLAAASWLGPSAHVSALATIAEHAERIPEPGWGGVLSLLWLPTATILASASELDLHVERPNAPL
jgi:hypothetical protein